jgi:Ni2+-binding GTPase involved in maturation of urease and hydrogenase
MTCHPIPVDECLLAGQIQVTVTGPIQSGKTYVSAALEECLQKLGYQVNVFETDSSRAEQREWARVRKLFRAEPSRASKLKRSVQITVVNGP